MRPLTFTAYRGARAAAGEPHTKPWADWCELFGKRDVREAKEGPCVILGEIAKGKRRSAANVRAAHAIGIDIEKLTDAQIEAAFEALRSYEHYVWTTHSHAPSQPRLRIVVPFADPIEPSDYPQVWAGLNTLIGGVNDPTTKDISRLHYLPSCPPGAERHHRGWHNAGRLITPDDLPDGTIGATTAATAPVADDPLMAARLAAKVRLKMAAIRNNEPIKPLTKALLEGDPLADAGGRHRAIRDLTWWIAEKTKDATPTALSELFGASLASMRQQTPNDSPSLEEVWDAYASAVRKLRDADKRAEERRAEERRKRAREQQIAAVGSAAYYDDDDLARIAGAHGWEPDELRDRWLVQREGMHWMLDASGAYRGPYSKEDAAIMASKLLARAPVRLMESSRNGTSYRPLSDVTRESGQVVERVVSDMIKQRTVFDPDTLTLYEAVRPLRKLEPRFDEGIDAWLKLLAGPQYARLVDWLACVSDLSKLLCAVYFDGAPGSGKTLLAFGLARLWTEGPPGDIELVLSDFNDEIARCPLVLADEEIPRKYRSATVTTALRTILSTMSRTFKRKFKPATDLHGAVRLVLAANNEFLLDSKEVSSAQDLDAIAQRFLYINVSDEATGLLNNTPRKVREAWATDGIARHALWLRDNHTIEMPGKRFWVEGDVSQMHRLLMTGSKWNSLCCEWLCRYLMQPNLYDTSATGLIRRGAGELLINDQALIDGWELYIKNTKTEPETAKIGAALRALSSSSRRKQLRNKNARTRYRIIDVDHILAWSDRHNIGDREVILGAVGEDAGAPPPADDGPLEDFGSVPTANDEAAPF